MLYDFKNDNYKNFDVFKDNVLKSRSYFIPFKSRKKLEKTDIRSERYNSDEVEVLSGRWDFVYYSDCNDLPKSFNTDEISFDVITVPSCWQFTGYEKPYYVNTRYQFKPDPPKIPANCSVGVYRKMFDVENTDGNLILSFLGVAGALDVYLNGRYVGYSEGSHNTSEFDIKPFVKKGSNELVVLVHKFSNGTYLECQDMFRNNGIFRDVLLFKYETSYIYDLEINTPYQSGEYALELSADVKAEQSCQVKAELFDGEQLIAAEASDGKIQINNLNVSEWSAEIPKLYTLIVTLISDGEELEYIRKQIGFKHIEIKGNVFYFNDEKIKLLGVNHHDTDEKKGYVMSVSDMERDIRLCKEHNVNCIRTSHYPPDSTFLDLCDEYGIYVVDEADIETHGCQTELHRPGACSHNPEWKSRYLDRVERMYERDKNHVCITMWSLGNEAWGYSNQDACYELLKKRTAIPIHYENVVHTKRFAYDVISQMYPWQGKMKKLADGKGLPEKWYSKPYFLCEYAHAMGVGAGELETYVKDFLRADNIMGGCIWEFADHAVYHENGKYKYTYGGDHGEEKHDKNFCVDGLFFPDRTPHAGALQMKNCYRPVRAELVCEDCFEFTNLNYFKPVKFTVIWNSVTFKEKRANGKFELDIAPRKSQRVYLPESVCQTINFRYFCGDREIASEGFNTVITPLFKIEKCDSFPYSISFGKSCVNLTVNEIETKIGASVFRAPLDNDMYLNKVWKLFNLKDERLELVKVRGNSARYNLVTKKNCVVAKLTISYKACDLGLQLNLKCDSSMIIPFIPRFGLTLETDKRYENVKYFGYGDRVNLPDFREHALLGEYNTKVCDMREMYIKPQESSMRSGVRYVELYDNDGKGIRFDTVDLPCIFGADRFTSKQCAEAKHQEELELGDFTYLHFDAYQLGAGSGACGPVPTKYYRLNSLKNKELAIMVKPI